jgi:hypothetical protein
MSQLNYYQNDAISVQYDAYDTNTGGELTTGVTFDKSSGTLPENASLSANGLLSGTANVTGNNSFTIKASKDGYEDKVGLSVNWVISAPLAQDIQLTYTGSLDLKQAGDSINFTATPINFEPSNNIT